MAETFLPAGSDNIAEVSYDRTTNDMTVTFVDGDQYRYRGVPPEKFLALQTAPSTGGYFYRNIRTAYPYEQV